MDIMFLNVIYPVFFYCLKSDVSADFIYWPYFHVYLSFFILFSCFFLPTAVKDVGNETSDICDTSVQKKKIVVTYGQSVHLGCFVKIPEVLKDQQVSWYHHSKDKGR